MICLRCLAQQSSSVGVIRNSVRDQITYQSRSTRLFTQITRHSDASQPFTTPPAASPSTRYLSTTASAFTPELQQTTNESTSSTPAAAGSGTESKSGSSSIALKSGTPAGTILRGLNFYKDKSDPLAMEDKEYPDWLWNVLDEIRGPSAPGAKDRKGESAKTSKKKKDKRGAAMVQEEVPIHRQTIDLLDSDGSQDGTAAAAIARAQVTKAMRAERRAKIKESNFLKTMR